MHQRLNLPRGLDGNLWHYHLGGPNVRHHHAELEFNLVTSGRGLYLLENRKYEIRQGDLLWLFPAQEHILVNQSPDFQMWIGVIKPGALQRLATEPEAMVLRQKNPTGDFCRRLAQPVAQRLETLFAEIVAQQLQVNLFNAGLAYAFLTAWRQFSQASKAVVQDVHPAVEKAARLIRDEHCQQRLEALATQAGLSPHRLSRLFKQQTGVALVEFRNRQRVEKFLNLYGSGQRITMLNAALEAGFGSYAQFHRVFRRITGRSPGSQRQRQGDSTPWR